MCLDNVDKVSEHVNQIQGFMFVHVGWGKHTIPAM